MNQDESRLGVAARTGERPREDLAFVSFWLGPVQSFIASARTVRDLWTGSYLLAWLTRQAMQPIFDALQGAEPDLIVFVSPSVKNNPALELGKQTLQSPCLPNRFVVQAPAARALQLADACRDCCVAEWREVGAAVRTRLTEEIEGHLSVQEAAAWRHSLDALWSRQLESYFEMRTAVLPWAECDEGRLAALLDTGRRATGVGDSLEDRIWSDRFEVLAGLQGATKVLRHIPAYQPVADAEGRFPAKCSLMGSYEQLGPARLDESAAFWERFSEEITLDGTHTRKRERLCALSLVKRFAWPAYFVRKTSAEPRALRFDDTATVAATDWLAVETADAPALDPDEARRRYKDWSGQWLHWTRRHDDEEERACPEPLGEIIDRKKRLQGKPPTYYGVLKLDGDAMGEKLRAGVGAAHQQAISGVLSRFAVHHVPRIVERHRGVLIYAGGDDALVLLPTSSALHCARELSETFQKLWRENKLPAPDLATVSGGLAIVHYKEDLRFALSTARRGEKDAKDLGRNALMVAVCRRSGEHTRALCPWGFVTTVAEWVAAFLPQPGQPAASDRWAYHLASELATLRGLPCAAMQAEIKRQVARAEASTAQRLLHASSRSASSAPELLASQFADYYALLSPRGFSEADALSRFVMLCQTASFLERGRDQ